MLVGDSTNTDSANFRPLSWIEQHDSTCLASRVDSAHHLYGVGEMSTSLQETGEKQVRIVWSTIRLPTALLKMMIIMRDATLWTCLHMPVAVWLRQEQPKEKNFYFIC